MILINPPISKPCEPPAGLARLVGAVGGPNRSLSAIDANLDGILRALSEPVRATDTWTRRAAKNLQPNLDYVRSAKQRWAISKYTRAVMDIHRVLAKSTESAGTRVSLSDYQDDTLSPVRSSDLLRAAEYPEKNPFYPYFPNWLIPGSSAEQDQYVGISLNYLSQALTAFSMMGHIRKRNPMAKIILGGGLVTSWLKRPEWRNPFEGLIDAIVAGPGESYLRTLFGMDACERHTRPRYDLFPLDRYFSPGLILPYSASSGCYWRKCLFCPEMAEGNCYVPLSVDSVLDDLSALIETHRPVMVHFLDNAMSPALLKGLITRPLNTPWYGFARMTDHFKDPGFCFELKKSGCVMLKIGIESGDQGVLDNLQKGIDLETASVSLHNIKRAGIGTYLYFLFGTPAEGRSEAIHTLDFVQKHSRVIDFLNLAIFNMPTNGPGIERFNVQKIYEGDLSLYSNFEHPKGWNRDKVRSFVESEFKTDPAVRSIIQRNPPFFTSNHAAFFLNG